MDSFIAFAAVPSFAVVLVSLESFLLLTSIAKENFVIVPVEYRLRSFPLILLDALLAEILFVGWLLFVLLENPVAVLPILEHVHAIALIFGQLFSLAFCKASG
jgi:hypothetical protein